MKRLARILTQASTFSQLDDAYGPTDSSLEEMVESPFLCPLASFDLWWDTRAVILADTTCLFTSLNPHIAVIGGGGGGQGISLHFFEANEVIVPSSWPLS